MKLLWLDLETTGLDPRESSILEVAVSVADLSDPFDATPALHRILFHTGCGLSGLIRNMHYPTGLLADCALSVLTRSDVEQDLLAVVPEVDDYNERPVLAGASVHFDLGFIREHWPMVAGRLSHHIYDTTAIVLFCESLGMPKPPRAEDAHRAQADVLASIARAKTCAEWLGKSAAKGAP